MDDIVEVVPETVAVKVVELVVVLLEGPVNVTVVSVTVLVLMV